MQTKTADFYFSTRTTVHGPWLLDSNQLADLDKTIDDVWKVLSAHRDEAILHQVEDRLNKWLQRNSERQPTKKETASVREEILNDARNEYPNNKFNREITLFLEGNKKLKVNSLKEAATHAGVSDVEAYGFIVELKCIDVNVELVFDGNYRNVNLQVTPERLSVSREIFALIKNWIDNNQPPKWQRNWGRIAYLFWMVWLFGFVIGSLLYSGMSNRSVPRAETEAKEILAQGVTVSNQLKAIETLLALEVGPRSSSTPISIPNWWLAACFLGLSVCLIMSLQPNGHLGIGKGTILVRRWRGWIRFITFAVPTFIFSSFISPALVGVIQRLFR